LSWTLFADVLPDPTGFKVGGFEFHANHAFFVAVGVAAAALIASLVLAIRWLTRRRKK
jgi:hypothetical protein